MKLLTQDEMLNLTTARLLAYRNSLLRVPEREDTVAFDPTGRMCKDHPAWKKTYAACLAVLKKRGHVERKAKGKRRPSR